MASAGDIVTNLTMNSRAFVAGAKVAQSSMATLKSSVIASVSGITAALGPVAALFAGAFALRNSLEGARTQIKAEQKLAAVLNATGGAAQLSAKEIANYASELQSVTNIGDEVTIGAASVLATFKNISGQTFKDALASAQDLSTVMGTDLNAASMKLGKALNDPIRGITALTRVGVSFTEQQREQIRAMQESGDIAGAQQILIEGLKSSYAGAAKSVADPWVQLKNTVGDVAENIGMALLPAINSISRQLNGIVSVASGAAQSFKEIGAIGGVVFDNLGLVGELAWARIQLGAVQLTSTLHHLFTAQLPAFFDWFGRNWSDLFFTAFDLATTVFINLGQNIRNAMAAIWEFISGGGTKELEIAWKPLTDGFVNTLKELPNIPERPIGDLEKRLQADVDSITGKLAGKMAEAIATVSQDSSAGFRAAVEEQTDVAESRASASSASAALQSRSSEAASAIARAFNDARSPQVKIAEAQLKQQQLQTKLLTDIAANSAFELMPAGI